MHACLYQSKNRDAYEEDEFAIALFEALFLSVQITTIHGV